MKRINEGTYEDFFMHYGEEIRNALTVLRTIKKKINDGELGEDDVVPQLEKLDKIYDGRVVDWIDSEVSGGSPHNADAQEIARIAIDNMNSTGTEVQMILYAIEELGSALGIYPGMDESYRAKFVNPQK